MIKFNNVELTNIAPVKIEDINVSNIQLNPVARPRPIAYGSEFVRMSGGTRSVTVSFALLETDREERERVMQDIRDWASIGKEYTLELPEFNNRHLECAVTQLPDYSYRKWWENKLKIVFTCFNNPYWTSNELIEVPCGAVFSIGGSAQPLLSIFRNGATELHFQSYSDGRSVMTFSRIPAGETVIDLNAQTAAIGNGSIMRYYLPSSSWIVPKVGAYQNITGAGYVRYRERWV